MPEKTDRSNESGLMFSNGAPVSDVDQENV